MPEYARKTVKDASGANGGRAWARSATQIESSSSSDGHRAPAGQETLQAALNEAPAVQAVAQLKRALNQGSRVGQVTQLSTVLQETHRESVQGTFGTVQRVEEEELLQGRFETAQREAQPDADAAPNRTGMPDGLKTAVESLSGMDLSDVRVHTNSDSPANLGAHAYAQGSDIHLAPGQERQLPHEAWHVVQQRQGRVVPTMQMQGVNINDDRALETEADRMGAQASQMKRDSTSPAT
jgi:hypothetical protein